MTMDLTKLTPKMPEAFRKAKREPDAPGAGAALADEFSNILDEKLGDLVSTTQDAARLQRDFAAGKTDNIHEVMIAGAKANLAVETALQIRNLALRAYQTLSQLR